MVEQVGNILDWRVSCPYSEADHCWDVEGFKRATESNRGHGRCIFAWARDETNNRNNEYKKRFRGAANHGLASGAPMTASLVAGTNKRQPPRTDLRFISQSFFRKSPAPPLRLEIVQDNLSQTKYTPTDNKRRPTVENRSTCLRIRER
jgi:hypothetical protein